MLARTDYIEELALLIESARLQFMTWMDASGHAGTRTEQRVAVIQDGHHTWRSETVNCELNPADWYIGGWNGGLSGEWAETALALARRLAIDPQSHLPFWNVHWAAQWHTTMGLEPFRKEFEDDPGRWVLDRVIFPIAIEYIRSSKDFRLPQSDLQVRLATAAVNIVMEECLTVVSKVAVAGIATALDKLVAGPLTIRRLTPLERGDLLRESTIPQVGGSGLGLRLMQNDLPTHVIEIREQFPKNPQPTLDPDQRLWSALGAFYLNGYSLSGPGHVGYRGRAPGDW